MNDAEMDLQQRYAWARGRDFPGYSAILGHYQVQACVENGRPGSLLDLPCGDGLLTQMFAAFFDRVVGVDASSARLEEARSRLPQGEFHHALIEELTLSERFDNVAMLNVLEHVRDPVAVLQRAATWLKPRGILHVHVPNALAVNRQIAVLMGTLIACEELSPFDIQVAGHRRFYTLESLVADAHAAGLKVVATGGVFYKMLSTPQMDWFLTHGLWEQGGFGWGRVGAVPRDWRAEFCRACYEFGKTRPEECNIVYACLTHADQVQA